MRLHRMYGAFLALTLTSTREARAQAVPSDNPSETPLPPEEPKAADAYEQRPPAEATR